MKKNKIVDTDYLYVTARIRSLECKLLNRERMERMLEANSDEEAAKVLLECGYPDAPGPSSEELEKALMTEQVKIFAFLEAVTPQHALIDVFRVKYDYHNIKAILKAGAMSLEAEPLMIDSGRIKPGPLMEMVWQDDMKGLPPVMREAALEAREVLAHTGDPQQSDMVLDSAYFEEMRAIAADSQSEFLKGYVRLYIDATNLCTVVRSLRIGRETDFLRVALVDGGNVEKERLVSAAVAGAPVVELFSGTALEETAAAGSPAARGETSLTTFERLGDDALLRYLKTAKFIAFGEQPLVAFIAAKETEIISIRTIMQGRRAGVPHDVIRERLREAYV